MAKLFLSVFKKTIDMYNTEYIRKPGFLDFVISNVISIEILLEEVNGLASVAHTDNTMVKLKALSLFSYLLAFTSPCVVIITLD